MAAVYLFVLSLMVFCFAMYVYENERNMMQFKLECMYSIKEKNKDVDMIWEVYDDVWRRIEDITKKQNKAIGTINALVESLMRGKKLECPDGWIMREHNCYIFIKTPKTWEEAEADCTKKQAHLITIDDNGMVSTVHSMLKEYEVQELWIGNKLQDDDSLSFESWYPSDPNQYREQNCLYITEHKIIVIDGQCSHRSQYACEKKYRLK